MSQDSAALVEEHHVMSNTTKNGMIVVAQSFNYTILTAEIAEQARAAAERIRDKIKKTLANIIEIGQDLLVIKDALPHGQFLRWIAIEFEWNDRMAENFMNVAEQFGPKSAIIANLIIVPTAAYLLAAPSTPEEARTTAVARAEAGEKITVAVAKEIVAKVRKRAQTKARLLLQRRLSPRLEKVLERYRDLWSPRDILAMAKQLRSFADDLEKKHWEKNGKER